MTIPARERLACLLADRHAASGSAPVSIDGDALKVRVTGVGSLTWPVRAPQARQLIGVARPAAYGRGEDTLLDSSVRDTWELVPDQIELVGGDWQPQLDAALEHLRVELGLPEGSRLQAELHAMLLYGKGQFFRSHQDSEKHDDMVATLVVMLPSVHTGGELIVEDGERTATYRGSRDNAVLVAFYADRRHEIRPVRSGHRVVLTFNLRLSTAGATPRTGSGRAVVLSNLVTEHFTTRLFGGYDGRDLGTPTRLAVLLDHEYSQRSIAARRFKGVDAEWVTLLESAAELAGCRTALALSEIHQTWQAYPDQSPEYFYEDDYGDEADDDREYELAELLDEEFVLGWWVTGARSGAEVIHLGMRDDEVCAPTPSSSLTPYSSEYEGYMGNYGDTVDRWYRRAAVVLWPRSEDFSVRAEANPEWGLRTLCDLIDSGDVSQARAGANSLERFWHHLDAPLLRPALQAALGTCDAEVARMLLAPFRLEMVGPDHAALLAGATREYGSVWWRGLLEGWAPPRPARTDERINWVTEALPSVSGALREHHAAEAADMLSGQVWKWLSDELLARAGDDNEGRRRARLSAMGPALVRLLESGRQGLAQKILVSLRRFDDRIIDALIPALRAHESPAPAAIDMLARDCRDRLNRIAAQPPRAKDDWSISWTGCGCGICDHLNAFLGSATVRSESWPLAKPGRQHVHERIDRSGLPVTHTTLRQGRPFTLVLGKTEDLFAHERATRRRVDSDLRWLDSAFGAGSGRTVRRGRGS